MALRTGIWDYHCELTTYSKGSYQKPQVVMLLDLGWMSKVLIAFSAPAFTFCSFWKGGGGAYHDTHIERI